MDTAVDKAGFGAVRDGVVFNNVSRVRREY
jgi:hypothetical protein